MSKFTNSDIKAELENMKTMIRNKIDSILDSNQFFSLSAQAFFDYGKVKIFAKVEQPGDWENKGIIELDDGCCIVIRDTMVFKYKGVLKDSLVDRGFEVVEDFDWLIVKLK